MLHTAGRRADRRMVVAAVRAGGTPRVTARDERGVTPIASVVGWMERAIADARLFRWTHADGRVGAVAAGHRFRVDRTAGDRAAVGARMAGRLDEARAWLEAEHDIPADRALLPYAVEEEDAFPFGILPGGDVLNDARDVLDGLDIGQRLSTGLWAIYR